MERQRRSQAAHWRGCALAAVLALALPATAHAQIFIASRPSPQFAIGPLFLRAAIPRDLGPVTVDFFFSVTVPPGRTAANIEQDLYLVWPGEIMADPKLGGPDAALTREVTDGGFYVVSAGRTGLFARELYARGGKAQVDPVPGGAPFVTYVRTGGAMGLTSPATWIRIPWTPKLVNRAWIMDLRLVGKGLIKPKAATWVEETFWGRRYRIALSFDEMRQRAVFPMYYAHRDRVLRLADEPAELIVTFPDVDHLKIDELAPASAKRQRSEVQKETETVTLFLDRSAGLTPQTLTVQFGYFSGWQSWAPVLIPAAFFILGNLAGPLLKTAAERLGARVKARVHVGRRDDEGAARSRGEVIPRATLARIVPGVSTYDDVLRLCGPNVEEHEALNEPERRTLFYRGNRVVPQRRPIFSWLATVSHWAVEHHEVEIVLERGIVRDVQARVRRSRLATPNPA